MDFIVLIGAGLFIGEIIRQQWNWQKCPKGWFHNFEQTGPHITESYTCSNCTVGRTRFEHGRPVNHNYTYAEHTCKKCGINRRITFLDECTYGDD